MDDILAHPALDDREESVRIAVRALGDMRNSVHRSPSASFQTTPALTIASRSSSPSVFEEESPDFVSRVSHLPIVNSAIRVYEQGKASSRVVKYGAEMMESSVKTISRPVIDRLPVDQLDEFACRQLDRMGYARRRSTPEAPRERDRQREQSPARSGRGWTSALRDMSLTRGRTREGAVDANQDPDEDVCMSREDGRSSSQNGETHSRTPTPRQEDSSRENQQQVVQRSRWQAVLLEAGGIGAAVSEESMRRLKYCLQWLQYATTQIDQQILRLRDFIASMQRMSGSPSSASSQSPATSVVEEQLQVLTAIRRDVVDTIRQVVDVVSQYAGGALPEPARVRVRSFILSLPQRWAHASATTAVAGSGSGTAAETKNTRDTGRGRGRTAASAPYSYGPGEAGPSPHSRPASRASSPSSFRAHGRHGRQANGNAGPTASAATQAAQKILTLATESLDMLRAVTAIFKESLDKADAWVERLRIVGLQRHNSNASPPPTLPPPSSLEAYREPLPPILTPGSSRAHSPESPFAQLTLPPLDPSLYSPSSHSHHHNRIHHNHHHVGSQPYPPVYSGDRASDGIQSRTGEAAHDLDALTLGSGATSQYSSQRSLAVSFTHEDEGGRVRVRVDDRGASEDVRRSTYSATRETLVSVSTKMDVDTQ